MFLESLNLHSVDWLVWVNQVAGDVWLLLGTFAKKWLRPSLALMLCVRTLANRQQCGPYALWMMADRAPVSLGFMFVFCIGCSVRGALCFIILFINFSLYPSGEIKEFYVPYELLNSFMRLADFMCLQLYIHEIWKCVLLSWNCWSNYDVVNRSPFLNLDVYLNNYSKLNISIVNVFTSDCEKPAKAFFSLELVSLGLIRNMPATYTVCPSLGTWTCPGLHVSGLLNDT